KSGSAAVEKWKRAMGGVSRDYIEGVQSTDVDPMALAAKAQDKWAQNVAAAASDSTFAKGCQRAGKSGWLEGCLTKGASNIATGAAKIADRKQAEMSAAIDAAIQSGATIANMPNLTLEDAKQRMLRNVDNMVAYGKRRR